MSCTDAVVINPSADGLSKVYYNKGKCDSKKSKVGPYPLGMCVHMALGACVFWLLTLLCVAASRRINLIGSTPGVAAAAACQHVYSPVVGSCPCAFFNTCPHWCLHTKHVMDTG